MKPRYLICILFIVTAVASCVKKADIWERAKVNEVKLLSFGFYKADNPDLLIKDFVIKQVNSNNLTVLLPADVDRTKLKARFTVGENDITRVGGVVQKSGETSNDFTVPVDYFLSDGNYNAKYTVTIVKGGDFVWSPIPFTLEDSAVAEVMKVSPVTGFPYIMYKQSRPSSSDARAAMASFENNEWVNKGTISDGVIGSYFDFTFNNTGAPYVTYTDNSATVAQANTVKMFDGAAWTTLGSRGFTPVKVTYNALAFDNDGKLQVFTTVDAAGGGFVRRELAVGIWSNNSWSLAKLPVRASTMVTYRQVAKFKNNAVYLGIYNAITPNSISVYKYENNTWSTLMNAWKDPNGTSISLYDIDIEVDDDGNVYTALADNSSSGTVKHRVIKYDAATQTVSPVGGYIVGSGASSMSLDLALSPIGTPYLFFKNSSNHPTLISFDNETQDWAIPHVFETEVAEELSLDFAPNGDAYATYIKKNKLMIYKYSTP
ncbi:MAG: hypothetical protein J7578_16425 [Chitinophagaceae bacterium]|nr:hypothetical protein [Chitinophagaceae bacterium]